MARVRLRPLRREPIRVVDAVVVPREEVRAAQEYRSRAGEYIAAALDEPAASLVADDQPDTDVADQTEASLVPDPPVLALALETVDPVLDALFDGEEPVDADDALVPPVVAEATADEEAEVSAPYHEPVETPPTPAPQPIAEATTDEKDDLPAPYREPVETRPAPAPQPIAEATADEKDDQPAPYHEPVETQPAPAPQPIAEATADEKDDLPASYAPPSPDEVKSHVVPPTVVEADAVVDDEYEEFDDEDLILPVSYPTTCRIAVWHGYRKATFYAQAFDSYGDEVGLAESPPFRYRGNGLPERTDVSAAAHRALVELLSKDGWRAAEAGSTWFDLTFTRD